MRIFHHVSEAVPAGDAAVALGYFDGLHRGHTAVIGRALFERAHGLCPAIFTFTTERDRPTGKQGGSALLTDTHKYQLLEAMGVETVLSPDFAEFCGWSPAAFVERVLVEALGARFVCCGRDFRFGAGAAGDVNLLRELCEQRGIRVCTVDEVLEDGRRISSTWVRQLLREGNPTLAGHLLGRAFGYDFEVVRGKQLGRTLDFPTINQPLPVCLVYPRFGVYVSVTYASGRWYPSVTNVGVRPSVEDGTQVNSETYICGFSGNLYGVRVPVRLLRFLRPEQRFADVAALRAQIQADARTAEPVAAGYLERLAAGQADFPDVF